MAIARALAMRPDALVCDEPVASLDVSIQAQIINLFLQLRRDLNLTMLFISHDLSVVRHVSDRVAIMYLGRIVEIGPTEAIFLAPRHPYTRALLKTIPALTGKRAARLQVIEGQPPIMTTEPTACPFCDRCAHVFDRCRRENPARRAIDARPVGFGHDVACHWTPEGANA